MQVTIGNIINVLHPTPDLIKWCKDNLILDNPEYSKKLRMNLWLGNTPQKLFLYEIRGECLILPFGVLRQIIPFIWNCDIETDFGSEDNPYINYNGNVPLYDYQEEAVNVLLEEYYGILQSPAGSGKTQMGISVISRVGKRALWLTHTKDLLDQSKSRAERYIDKSLIGTITEGKVDIGSGVTFATIQTMCRLDLSQLKYHWDLIIVDECHRCAGTPTAVTQFSKVLNSLSAKHKYGLSATVHRSDGMIGATYALLGEVVYEVPEEAVGDKIMKVGIRTIPTPTHLSTNCLNTDGTLNYARLINHLCTDSERNKIIVQQMIDNKDCPSLVLSDRLQHLKTLMAMLPDDMRANAIMVDGKMTTKKGKEERERATSDMRTGKKKYLFASYPLAKEGLDIPRLERLFMATPVKDYTVVTQSIGRIARICPNKKQPIVYDFVDDIRYTFKMYKQRLRHYKKAGAFLCGEDDDEIR